MFSKPSTRSSESFAHPSVAVAWLLRRWLRQSLSLQLHTELVD